MKVYYVYGTYWLTHHEMPSHCTKQIMASTKEEAESTVFNGIVETWRDSIYKVVAKRDDFYAELA